jgi:Spy/CpxP family protein refolding chaperone
MIRKTTLAAAALTALSAVALALAQNAAPPAPPDPQQMIQMRVDRMGTVLGLTDAQKASAVSILTAAHDSAQTIQTSLRTNREALDQAVKSNDAASINSLATAIGGQEGQILAIQSKAEAAFYALLTTDQKTKYDSMPHMFGGPGGGFGGPGGPGGPGRGGFGAGGANTRMRRQPAQ